MIQLHKLFILLAGILILSACGQKKDEHHFFVGTYTDGESQGIYSYLLQEDGNVKSLGLAAESTNPSFLVKSADHKYVIAVNETEQDGEGSIASFSIDDEKLEFISKSKSGGAHPCYISMDEKGFVLTANYSGGNVALHQLNEKGVLSPLLDIQQHHGKGTTDRQQGPHAHSCRFEGGSNRIISLDLGSNQVIFSHIDVEGKKFDKNIRKVKMKKGAGPRHFDFHPNKVWLYVLNELDCTITLFKKSNPTTYQKDVSVSTLPKGYSGSNTAADIHISEDGRFVYASNRGHNTIAVFRIDPIRGKLSLIGHQQTHGEWPRNFSLSPKDYFLLVANQHTNNIVSFKRDSITGLLEYVNQIDAPSPVCILF